MIYSDDDAQAPHFFEVSLFQSCFLFIKGCFVLKQASKHRTISSRHAVQLVCCLGLAFFSSACATTGQSKAQAEQSSKQMKTLVDRLEEVERTNGRLTVRMEELEDQLFLLNDRVESHRIALQRRTYQPQQVAVNSPQAPQPAPESYYYGDGSSSAAPVYKASPRRPVQRIRLGKPEVSRPTRPAVGAQSATTAAQEQEPAAAQDDYEDVVISEDEYRKFFGEPSPSHSASASTSRTTTGGKRAAQPPVTSERLGGKPTQNSPAPAASAPTTSKSEAPVTAPKSSGLQLYKESLAQYRSGNYNHALVGFQAFLKSRPKQDYIDNALYWIGECYYGLGEYSQAITHFQKVLSEQPDGNKVPDAMLKMSLALEKSGEQERSKEVLRQLIGEYPQTHAAGLGRKRLQQ